MGLFQAVIFRWALIIRKNTSATYLPVRKCEVREIRIVKHFIGVLTNNYFLYPEKREESKLKKDCEQICWSPRHLGTAVHTASNFGLYWIFGQKLPLSWSRPLANNLAFQRCFFFFNNDKKIAWLVLVFDKYNTSDISKWFCIFWRAEKWGKFGALQKYQEQSCQIARMNQAINSFYSSSEYTPFPVR